MEVSSFVLALLTLLALAVGGRTEIECAKSCKVCPLYPLLATIDDEEALKEAWKLVDQHVVDSVLASMEDRVKRWRQMGGTQETRSFQNRSKVSFTM